MKRLIIQTLIILIAATAGSFGTYFFHPQRPTLYLHQERLDEDEVTLEEVLSWDHEPLWIDARSGDKYEESHIPEAISLNEQNWDDQITAIFERFSQNQAVVVYCDQHSCKTSKVIAKKIREQLGLSDVYTLRGGWMSWILSQRN